MYGIFQFFLFYNIKEPLVEFSCELEAKISISFYGAVHVLQQLKVCGIRRPHPVYALNSEFGVLPDFYFGSIRNLLLELELI